MDKMFPAVQQIHSLHLKTILPELKQQSNTWPDKKVIGSLFKKYSPFFKLYADFMKGHQQATALIKEWERRSPVFSAALKKLCSTITTGMSLFQSRRSMKACLKLDIYAHMLEPVQRIPRYILMLERYNKNLPEDDPERKIVSEALERVNEAARFLDNVSSLALFDDDMSKLQQTVLMPNNEPLLKPSRRLIHQGEVFIVRPASGKRETRQLLLFSDVVLVCNRSHLTGVFKFKAVEQLSLDKMHVKNGSYDDVTFHVCVPCTTLNICAKNEDEKNQWIKMIYQAIGELYHKRKNRHRFYSTASRQASFESEEAEHVTDLGEKSPVLIPFTEASMCMLCAKDFGALQKKHHCRACGVVVCESCSTAKMAMKYNNKSDLLKVCDQCVSRLNETNYKPPKAQILKSKYTAICTQQGYLTVSQNKGFFQKYWVELHEGGMMYCYKASMDLKPVLCLNLGTCDIELSEHIGETTVTITSRSKTLQLKLNNKHTCKWLKSIFLTKEDGDNTLSAFSSPPKASPDPVRTSHWFVDDKAESSGTNSSVDSSVSTVSAERRWSKRDSGVYSADGHPNRNSAFKRLSYYMPDMNDGHCLSGDEEEDGREYDLNTENHNTRDSFETTNSTVTSGDTHVLRNSTITAGATNVLRNSTITAGATNVLQNSTLTTKDTQVFKTSAVVGTNLTLSLAKENRKEPPLTVLETLTGGCEDRTSVPMFQLDTFTVKDRVEGAQAGDSVQVVGRLDDDIIQQILDAIHGCDKVYLIGRNSHLRRSSRTGDGQHILNIALVNVNSSHQPDEKVAGIVLDTRNSGYQELAGIVLDTRNSRGGTDC